MHKMAFAHVFGPEKKNGFGPFSYKFFVCIRVGLRNLLHIFSQVLGLSLGLFIFYFSVYLVLGYSL